MIDSGTPDGFWTIFIEAILGAFLTIQGVILRRLWATKPDREEMTETIKQAIDEFKLLDAELDTARLEVLVAVLAEREKAQKQQHVENLGRFDKLERLITGQK